MLKQFVFLTMVFLIISNCFATTPSDISKALHNAFQNSDINSNRKTNSIVYAGQDISHSLIAENKSLDGQTVLIG